MERVFRMATRGGPDANRAEERQITEAAVQAFEKATGLRATIIGGHVRLPEGRADAAIRFGGDKTLVAVIKGALTPTTMGQALAQVRRFGERGLIVTRYVTPPMAERLRELDAAFIDTAGNAYLRLPNLFIYVAGRKPRAPTPRETRVRALRPTGLRVIFALLCRPDLLNAPYRDIAEATGVALGTVTWVFYDLRRLGYVRVTKTHERILENRPELIDRWVEAYARELRPKLKPRRYHVWNLDWWKKVNLAELEMLLGGEAAAAVLSKHLRPQIITIYGDNHFPTLAKTVRALKNDHGNLELLPKFWNFDIPRLDKRYPLVPPLLIYADLVATADARNLEIAQIVRRHYLAKA